MNVAQELQCEHFYLLALSTFKAVYALPRVYLSSYVCRFASTLSLPLLLCLPVSTLSPYFVDLSAPPYPCYNFTTCIILSILKRAIALLLLVVLLRGQGNPFVFFSSAATATTRTVAAQCPLLLGHHQHHQFTSRSHFSCPTRLCS